MSLGKIDLEIKLTFSYRYVNYFHGYVGIDEDLERNLDKTSWVITTKKWVLLNLSFSLFPSCFSKKFLHYVGLH